MNASHERAQHSCRRFSLRGECATVEVGRTGDAGWGVSSSRKMADGFRESPALSGGSASEVWRCLSVVSGRFGGSGRRLSRAGRRLSWGGVSFPGVEKGSLAQDFHFPERDGRCLAEVEVLEGGRKAVWRETAALRLKIFILQNGRRSVWHGREGRDGGRSLSGSGESFSRAGETPSRRGETVSMRQWGCHKPMKTKPLTTDGYLE